jgi:hypothetical protein
MIDMNLVCNVAESWCTNFLYVTYLQEEQQGCLRSVLATFVFISTIIEVTVQSMLSSQPQCMFMQLVYGCHGSIA